VQSVPESVVATPGVVYAEVDGVALTVDVYTPADPPRRRPPAVVLVHGGGWQIGDPGDVRDEAVLFARQGWAAFAISYRTTDQLGTGGEAWPTELADVQRGIRWVGANAATYGADPDDLAVFGVSAGGHLAAMVGVVGTARGSAPPGTGAAPADPPDPNPEVDVDAVAVWSAPTDLAGLTAPAGSVPSDCDGNTDCSRFWTLPLVPDLLGCPPDACAEVSASASPAQAWPAGAPPLYLANAAQEIVPLAQPRALAARAVETGTTHRLDVVGGAGHADYATVVWNEMVPFLAEAMGVPEPEPIDFASTAERVIRWVLVALTVILVAALVVAIARTVREGRDEPGHAPDGAADA
jgi:acetyl esterase/lipase